MLASLPSDEEKKELIRTLDETRKFLEEFQLLIESIPTMESSQQLAQGLSRLDILAERARKDGGLRKLMGFREVSSRTVKRPKDSVAVEARAQALEQELSRVEAEDVLSTLERSREPLSVLTQLANRLGIRTRSKEQKAELTRKIATHISNWRGYRILRGEDPGSIHNAD